MVDFADCSSPHIPEDLAHSLKQRLALWLRSSMQGRESAVLRAALLWGPAARWTAAWQLAWAASQTGDAATTMLLGALPSRMNWRFVPAGVFPQPGRLYSTSSRMLSEGASGFGADATAAEEEELHVPKADAGSETQLAGPPPAGSSASPPSDMLALSPRKYTAEWGAAAAEMEASAAHSPPLPLAAAGTRGDRRRGLVTAAAAEELLVSKAGAGSESQQAGPPPAGSSAVPLPDAPAWSPRKYAADWGAAIAEMEASASTAPSPPLPLAAAWAKGDRVRSRTVPALRGVGYPSAPPDPRPMQEASLAALTLGAQQLTLLGQELRAAEHLRQQEQQHSGNEEISAPHMDGQRGSSGLRKSRRPGIPSASPSTEPASKSHNTGLRPGSTTASDATLQGLALSAGSEAQRLEGMLLQGLPWATLHEVALVVEAMSEAQQEISPGVGCGLPSRCGVWAVRQLWGVRQVQALVHTITKTCFTYE